MRGQRRQQRTRSFVEGRGQAAAGPHFQAGTFYSLSAGEKTFQKGWRGKTGPCWLCAPAPAPSRGSRRAARRRGLRAARPAGPERPGAESGAAADGASEGVRERPPLSAAPRGSRVGGPPPRLFLVSAVRAEMEFLTLSPPLLNL